MCHEGVLKEMEYVVKQFSKFLFSGDRLNTDGVKKTMALVNSNYSSSLVEPSSLYHGGAASHASALPVGGGQCDQWGRGGARNPCSTRLELSSTGLGGASSHCYDLVLAYGFYRSRCWPCQSKHFNWHPSVQSRRTKVTVFALGQGVVTQQLDSVFVIENKLSLKWFKNKAFWNQCQLHFLSKNVSDTIESFWPMSLISYPLCTLSY